MDNIHRVAIVQDGGCDTEKKSSHRNCTRDQPDTFARVGLLNGVVQGQVLANPMFIMNNLGLDVVVVLVVEFRGAHGLNAVAKCGLYKLSGPVGNGQHFSFNAFIYIFRSASDGAITFNNAECPRLPGLALSLPRAGCRFVFLVCVDKTCRIERY